MVQASLPDDLWSFVAAYLPTHWKSPKGSRPHLHDRATPLPGFTRDYLVRILPRRLRVAFGDLPLNG